MRRLRWMALAVAAMIPLAMGAKKGGDPSEIKVMSFNIRTGTAKDGTNSWIYRYPATAYMLRDELPDVFGIQEALWDQVLFIEENCREYKSVGGGRENGRKEGEYTSVFYNKKRISLCDWGMFWLSETPDKPSKGWDAECLRTATWAILKDKASGKKFLFVNTHLDHKGKQARAEGIALILEKTAEINRDSLPVVLTGDFNMASEDASLTAVRGQMKNAGKSAANKDCRCTYHGWGKESRVIDHIFFSGFTGCPEFRAVTKKYADRTYVSDHYPIVARLIF